MSARTLEVVEDPPEKEPQDRSSQPVPEEEAMQARSTEDGRRWGSLGAFLLGAAAGGLAGLLLAPMSGRELRGRISEEARKARDEAAEMARKTQETATEVVRKTQEKATEMAGNAQARARETYEETRGRARKAVDDTRAVAGVQKEALKEAWREGKAAYEKELDKNE